jgi:2-dehydropantoate 2-reductase
MSVLIVGAGALGKCIAAQLALSGMRVHVLVRREEQRRAICEKGIRVSREGRLYTAQVDAHTGIEDLRPDWVILTVKSYQTKEAAGKIASLSPIPPVLSMQNGLGNDRVLAEYFSRERILLGVCTHGATSLSDTEVAWNGVGEILIGSPFLPSGSPLLESLAELLSAAGLRARSTPEIEREIWRKAIVNCAINPLTAIARLKNGELLEREEMLRLMRDVVEEAAAVAGAVGVEVGDVWSLVLEVCRNTAENRSSMLQDLLAGRPTEIESLNGQIVQWAEEKGYSVSVNRTLARLVRALSQK